MRRVIFSCAMSLDGYLAGPNGEYDWIVMDPDVDFAAMMARFDTFLIGRKTYDGMRQMMGDTPAPRTVLKLRSHKVFEKTGSINLAYDIEPLDRRPPAQIHSEARPQGSAPSPTDNTD